MNWTQSRIREFLEINKKALIVGLLISACVLVWGLFAAQPFEWKSIEPIPAEAPHLKILSALVFVTLGNLLYELRFYQALSFIFVDILKDRQTYKDFKRLIWTALMLFVGWVIIPWAADLINQAISIFYNIFAFFVYLVPGVGIALLLFLIFNLAKHLLISIKSN